MSVGTVRRLGPADADALIELRREGLRELPLAFGASLEDDVTGDRARFEASLAPDSPVVALGVLVGEDLVGTIGLGTSPKVKLRHRASVWGAYVLPEHRGRGHGRALLRALVEHARAAGIEYLDLSVTDAAAAARALYESEGFEHWGSLADALRYDGGSVAEHHFVLALGSSDPGA